MSGRELVSQAEFARRMGWTRQYVSKLGKNCRLVLAGNLVDVEASIAAVQAGADPARQLDAPRPVAPGEMSFAQARAQRERANAQLAELELGERRGALLPRDMVEREAFERARGLRDRILMVPALIADELAVMTDGPAIRRKLDNALRQALRESAHVDPGGGDDGLWGGLGEGADAGPGFDGGGMGGSPADHPG